MRKYYFAHVAQNKTRFRAMEPVAITDPEMEQGGNSSFERKRPSFSSREAE
jgi:hypothetical protein